MDIHVGNLKVVSAKEHPELFAEPVTKPTLTISESDKIGVAGIDSTLSATVAFCEYYQVRMNQAASERNSTALMTAVAVGVTLIVALVVGEALLKTFGISLPSFRIAGGLLILLIALSMVLRRDSPTRTTMETEDRPVDKTAVAVAPLAIPLLAGPGAISSIIIYAHRADSVGNAFLIAAEIVGVAAIIFVVFRLAASIAALVSPTGLQIISRIMGLLLAAITVEFIGNGLVEIFPGLR